MLRPRTFTDYVRAVGTGNQPDPTRFQSLLEALRNALVVEMRRRGLLSSAPDCVGVYGHDRWVPEAVDEFLHDCYLFIFVIRLRSLVAQLKVKKNVDGLIFLNIRNYLHDRQRKHDPVGFRVFDTLRQAVRQGLANGVLRVKSGDEKVRNDTLLEVACDASTAASDPTLNAAVLARLAEEWNNDLLPDLVTARGRDQDAVVARLARRLPELDSAGVRSFRFKELVDPLKKNVRERWQAVWTYSEGETALEWGSDGNGGHGAFVKVLQPDTSVEDRQSFQRLLNCVRTAVETEACDERTRRDALTLWEFLRTQSVGGDGVPSRRKTADLLSIPRDRLTVLYKWLGEIVSVCLKGPARRRLFPRQGELEAGDREEERP